MTTTVSENKLLKTVEYVVEAAILSWLSYLLIYQNYLLYRWHRGLRKPSKVYFILAGVLIAAAFLTYEFIRLFGRDEEPTEHPDEEPTNGSAENENANRDGKENVDGEGEEKTEEPDLRA